MRKEKSLRRKIDELEKMQHMLKEENAILKGIQAAMPDPYFVRDMDYNIILWPKEIEKVTGYSEKEAKK